MLPDIDSLALFVRAAELHSLTKAAEASHIGLAAASRRIAMLEHRFKTSLFERSPRGVELTSAGATLLRHAKLLLLQLNHLQADMTDHAAGHKGVLRVLANTSAMTEYLPDDLAAFGRSNPDVRLVVEERWSTEILDALQRGDADLGIVMEGIPEDGLDVTPYRSDRIAVLATAGHEIAILGDLRFEDVLRQDLIALESSSSMMRLLAEQAAVLETVLRLRVQVRSFEAVCRMVKAGLGIGVLPYQAAKGMGESMQLVVRPLAEPWAERRMLVCVRQDRAGNSSLKRLVAHLGRPAKGQPHRLA